MQPLEYLAEVYAKDIRKDLCRFNLDLDIRVEETVEQRPAAAFDHALLFGDYGCNDDDIAILASSERASYDGRPIQFMMIPPHPAGALLVARDNSTVAADFFYVIEEGIIKAIHTTEPVELDLLDLRLDLPYGYAARNKIPGYVLATRPNTQDFTNSKAETNAVLKLKRIRVPKQEVIYVQSDKLPYSYFFINKEISTKQNLKSSLDRLSIDRFVLKGDYSCGGDHVRMFGRHELTEAIQYARWLYENKKNVLLEERILPLPWKDENDQHIDWNIRTFVTLSENPQWIDAIVRYNVLGGTPVNICQHACVEELEQTVERTGASKKNIMVTALKVARAVYIHIKNSGETPTGFLGLDLIVNKKGVYTIEINSAGSGGFAELLEIRKKPLTSVRLLLESMGPLLENKHAQRTLNQYKRIPNTLEDYLDLAETFDKGQTAKTYDAMYATIRMYEKALSLMKAEALKTGAPPYKKLALAKYYELLIPIYIQIEQYEKAYTCHEEIKKIYAEKEKDSFGQLLQLGAAYERRK